MVAWIWVLIPIAAILVGAFQQWLKFKQETARIGSSTHDLQKDIGLVGNRVEQLESERDQLVRRIQNLEAIVTSEAWNTLRRDPELAAAKAQPGLDEFVEEDESDSRRAAELARRLRTR